MRQRAHAAAHRVRLYGWWRLLEDQVIVWRYWRHRGDDTSPWWSPVPGERVLDCSGRVATVLRVSLRSREAWLTYGAREPGRMRRYMFTACLTPVQWGERGEVVHQGRHGGAHEGLPVHVPRDLLDPWAAR
jgi:hypothetical protein